jgi:glycosyltransferase involved in cell wall biosynthesis
MGMNSLRILQLATSTNGGAGIAARRLHEALIENQIDSTLLTLTDSAQASGTFEMQRSPYKKLTSSIFTYLQSKLIQSSDQLLTPLSKNTLNRHNVKLHEYQVVHIHAFYNLLSTSAIIELCQKNPQKRFFVTLHDERFLTGGCHYSNGCQKIQFECRDCPQATRFGKYFVYQEYSEKMATLNNLGNLQLISPSAWLQNLARDNPATKGLKSHIVRNPVPQVFFNVPRLATHKDKLRIVFISAHLNTRMKGLTTLINALNLIAERGFSDQFELLFVGHGKIPHFLDSRIAFETAVTNTDEETANVLSRCQILALPSIQDNLPSTMTEAICAGLSVVGTRTGGIEEVLTAYEQSTVNVDDPTGLATELLSLLKFRTTPSKSKAIDEFSYSAVAESMFHIYNSS